MFSINHTKGKILLAISGGVDSMVLFDVFKNVYDKKDLVVGHFNHNLRGKESDGDEEFVKKICKQHGIKFYSKKAKVLPKNEEEARILRYQFLIEIFKKEKCDYLTLAHHKNDQEETLLYQLIRGTGSFSPMKECDTFLGDHFRLKGVKVHLWRPFLKTSKNEIFSYAKSGNIQWREDSSNQKDIYSRNKIRNDILPKLKELNSDFGFSIERFADITSSNHEFIQIQAEEFLNGKRFFSQLIFSSLHLSIQRAVIYSLAKFESKNLSFINIDEVVSMILKGEGGKEKHGFYLKNGIVFMGKKDEQVLKQNDFMILASASSQRKRLLQNLTSNFMVLPSYFPEVWNKKKTIEQNLIDFAEGKALKIARKYQGILVIGCDTVVLHPKHGVYEKPKDIKEAEKHLLSYSKSTVDVLSGLSFIIFKNDKIKKISKIIKTTVEFDKITKEDVKIWLTKNEWQGRSGSCSIEGYCMHFIKKIDGCFFNIIGLPINELKNMLSIFR